MIIDTDVLIWYLRGNERARIIVEEAVPFSITAVTCMELMQGMRNKEEMKSFLRQLHIWKVPVIQIDEDISVSTGDKVPENTGFQVPLLT